MAYSEKTRDSIINNNLKLTADKVTQILKEVRNEPKQSRRRWVWELLQNAKDVPNIYGRVSAEIDLSENQLSFRHNGDPFQINNLTGLIQQVSSKPSNSTDKKTTGKFGTGFISTHLLSDIIWIKGVVQEATETPKRVNFKLDRSGETSEELMPSIEKALELVDKIDDDSAFPPYINFTKERTESLRFTEFIYNLENEDSKQAAQVGVEDLRITLPLTLAFIEEIKEVRVINNILNEDFTYGCSQGTSANGLSEVCITITDNKAQTNLFRNFIIYNKEDISLAVEVNNFTTNALIKPDKSQPLLYRDFPLIGSESFHWPFILNGKTLFPTEKRNSIYLNGSKNDPAHNKTILKEAIEASMEFVDLLVKRNASNLYVTALSRLPKYEFEDDTRHWFAENIQKPYRKFLLEKPIIDTPLGKKELKHVYFPKNGLTQEDNLHLWSLVAPIVGFNAVPKQEDLVDALEQIGPMDEKETWELPLFFNLDSLFEKIEEAKKLEDLTLYSLAGDTVPTNKLLWLNKVFSFTISQKEVELLDEWEVVPNMNGDFKKLKYLAEEDYQKPIPDEFLDVLKSLDSNLDWRADIINRHLDLKALNHAKRNISDLTEAVNKILKEEKRNANNVSEKIFLARPDCLGTLVSILRIDSPNSTGVAFRHHIFNAAKNIFHFTESFTAVPNSQEFVYEPAIKLMISVINEAISSSKDMTTLGTKLQKDVRTSELWLSDYLKLLDTTGEYSVFLKEGNIVPNRLGVLCAYEELYNYGTEEQELDADLINILAKFDTKRNWWKDLLAQNIDIKLPNTRKFDELASEIMLEVNRVEGEKSYETYREPLLELIDWCAAHKDLVIRYLSGFQTLSNRIFFILTIENSSIGGDVIKMLKNKDNLEVLASISESNVDVNALKELINISSSIGGLDDILKHAQDLLQEKQDFDFKKLIGENVELIFKEALQSENIDAEIIHQGWGAHDFIIRNRCNGKSVYVELKSFANGSTEPIKMAVSQAEKAVQFPSQFALCMIERPASNSVIDTQYIKDTLQYKTGISPLLEDALLDNVKFEEIAYKQGEIKLHVNLREAIRVSIDSKLLKQNSRGFAELVADIKTQLQ
ncbi:sacsin N-terminal ATP-binding-like domain-containing protein [Pontibacter sp. H249]|uniref:sacsin N-terminal ATP-binding-like domain-containing protein n=1 Tax=Pontibacter sp. H249 TaxID=3133420 RepID=UPI0030C2E4CA